MDKQKAPLGNGAELEKSDAGDQMQPGSPALICYPDFTTDVVSCVSRHNPIYQAVSRISSNLKFR